MPTATYTPSDFEQLMLEFLNRARTAPQGEFDALIADAAAGTGVQDNITNALSYFGVDTAALQSQFASLTAVAPLAWNTDLTEAAKGHSEAMIAADTQSHQLPAEAGLGDRITATGYLQGALGYAFGENVYAFTEDPLFGHAGFFIDWGFDATDVDSATGTLISDWKTNGDGIQDPPGHRSTIMNSRYTEVGIAAIEETDSATQVGPYVVTQDFGYRSTYAPQLVGVMIADGDGDRFYDMGEGLDGITVTAVGTQGTFSTTSWSSGGYQMALPEGSYTVSFSGSGITGALSYAITMGAENLKLDGIAGDAVAFAPCIMGTSLSEIVSGTGGTAQMLIGKGGMDTLTGATLDDTLYGDDIEMTYHATLSGQVYRLYQATLDRAPDSGGHLDWVTQILCGDTDLQGAAGSFVSSAEFQAVYGALTNTQFVEQLYQNVLGRAADAAGLANWVGQLDGGTSRAAVVIGFSESPEFITATAGDAASYAQGHTPSAWTDDVFRLYQATLDRAPDLSGLLDWIGQLGSGQAYLSVVTGFVASTEFQTTYGALSDSAFVEQLYQNVLNRAADAAGLADWTGQLAAGTTREEVVRGFAQSGEFIVATDAALVSYVRGLGTDDRLEPGAGSGQEVYGGALSDLFVFASQAGAAAVSDTVIGDFEDWDRLHLEGFGYVQASDALANMTQSGADAVFADDNVILRLLNVTVTELDAAHFQLA